MSGTNLEDGAEAFVDEAGDVVGGGNDGGGSGGGTSSAQQINSIVPCEKRITKWFSTFR